jgi:signal transduction histidine kinase
LNKRFLYLGLKNKLIICLVFSFILATALFFLLSTVSDYVVDAYVNKTSCAKAQNMRTISDFRNYVSTHKLSTKDRDHIAKWVQKKKYVKLSILKNNSIVYNFTSSYLDNNGYDFGESVFIPLHSKQLYEVVFSDTKAKFYMDTFFVIKYYNFAYLVCLFIAFLCFVLIMLFFFKQKINYLINLEKAIKIYEGGDLSYNISVKGNDELASLAQSINEMKKSFIDQLENANRAKIVNNELITALSHDLRTPLTALIGYLDIIKYQKYKTEENLKRYIHNSREKASQIKSLSDKLFEYFTVVNNDEDLELQAFEGNVLFEQLLDDQIILLEDKGFIVEAEHQRLQPFLANINLVAIRRVFDNIFSNINKYADKAKPIDIKSNIEIDKQIFFINTQNQINKNPNSVKSTEMGLEICKNIIKYHNGKLIISKTDSVFSVQIRFPIKLK